MPFGGETAEGYYDEGLTATMKGDLAGAVRSLEKAVELDKNFMAAYHQLAKCYVRMGQNERAAEILQRLLVEKPDNITARVDLGFAFLGLGRTDEGKRHFDQVVAMDPSHGRGRLGLAYVRFNQGNWKGAMNEAQQALTHSGPNLAALFIHGQAAKLAGEPALSEDSLEEADALLAKSIELNPTQPEGYYLRGEVNFSREHFSTALEHYQGAEERARPGRAYFAYGERYTMLEILAKQALCYQRLGKIDRARELGERIMGTDPNHRLGRALKEL